MKKNKKIALSLSKKAISKFQLSNGIIGGQTGGQTCTAETRIICPSPDTIGGSASAATNCFSCGIC